MMPSTFGGYLPSIPAASSSRANAVMYSCAASSAAFASPPLARFSASTALRSIGTAALKGSEDIAALWRRRRG